MRSNLKSQPHLALENLALRQQLVMLRQSVRRPHVSAVDRFFWVQFSKTVDGWRAMLHVFYPDTIVRWHRYGFRRYWTFKSWHQRVGRPLIDAAIRKLIRQMQSAKVGWGAPRIHGELLKLGIKISQATVSTFMTFQGKPTSQTWRTFLANHTDGFINLTAQRRKSGGEVVNSGIFSASL